MQFTILDMIYLNICIKAIKTDHIQTTASNGHYCTSNHLNYQLKKHLLRPKKE